MNIQQLRAQIAALQDATMDENKNFRSAYDEGKFDALTAVDNLLDSLQEESIEMEDLIEEAKQAQADEILSQVVEEPTSKDLEEELSRYVNSEDYINSVGTSGLLMVAKHFAEWQKEKMMKSVIASQECKYVQVFHRLAGEPDKAGEISETD